MHTRAPAAEEYGRDQRNGKQALYDAGKKINTQVNQDAATAGDFCRLTEIEGGGQF